MLHEGKFSKQGNDQAEMDKRDAEYFQLKETKIRAVDGNDFCN